MLYAVVLFVVSLTSACSFATSESDIQTAIAKTQKVEEKVTLTNTQTETLRPSPTSTFTLTPEPTSTLTPTVTFTPTPDIRIIEGDPDDFILSKDDLPDKYILYPGDSTPHNNSEILDVRGVEEGKAYLDATGRIGGWIIYYGLVDDTVIAPEWIRSYIVMYDNVNGPSIAQSPEWDWAGEDREILDINVNLGDRSRVYTIRERQSSGKVYVFYAIQFSYRNVWAEVMGIGYESDIRHEYVENAARAVLEKLKNAPLSMPK